MSNLSNVDNTKKKIVVSILKEIDLIKFMAWFGNSRGHSIARYKSLWRSHNTIRLKKSNVPNSRFNKNSLVDGVIVEKEHSDRIPIRLAIAKAHLSERRDYYKNNLFTDEINSVNKQEREKIRRKLR